MRQLSVLRLFSTCILLASSPWLSACEGCGETGVVAPDASGPGDPAPHDSGPDAGKPSGADGGSGTDDAGGGSGRADAGETDDGGTDGGGTDDGGADGGGAGDGGPSDDDGGLWSDAGISLDADGGDPDGGMASSDAGSQAAAPRWPADARIVLVERGDVSLRIAWPEAEADEGVSHHAVTWGAGSGMRVVGRQVEIVGLMPATSYMITVSAVSAQGLRSAPLLLTAFTAGTEVAVPPEVPPVDATLPAGFGDLVGFLAEAEGYQQGVLQEAIVPERESLLSGIVRDVAGEGMVGVEVHIVGHPEYGSVRTLEAGAWFFLVTGQQELIVRFDKEGFMPVQRRVMARLRDSARAEEVILQRRDEVTSLVDLRGESTMWQMASSSPRQDCEGCPSRRARVLFPPGVGARVWRSGAWRRVTEPSRVQLTEFTVGEGGAALMPGALPPNTGYTYAVDLFVHQGIEKKDGIDVQFVDDADQPAPVFFYGENFLGVPVGARVPSAYYEFEGDAWVPMPDGWIVGVTGIEAGLAQVDVGDSGLALSEEERAMIATFAEVGQSYMRMPLAHFSNCDFNFGLTPAPWARPPNQPEPWSADGFGGEGGGDPPEGCTPTANGSRIDCFHHTLGQEVPVAGTSLSLHYNSKRTVGYRGQSRITVPLTHGLEPEALAGLLEVRLSLYAAGRSREWLWDCTSEDCTELSHEIEFGQFSFNRVFNGETTAQITITHVYPQYYVLPPRQQPGASFGRTGEAPDESLRAREDALFQQRHIVRVGNFTHEAQGLGGWTLSAHHVLDRRTGTLMMGTGDEVAIGGRFPLIETLYRAGDRLVDAAFGNVISSSLVSFRQPMGVHIDADGTLLVGATASNALIRVDDEGQASLLLLGRSPWNFESSCAGEAIDRPSNRAQVCAKRLLGGIRGLDGRVYLPDFLGDYNETQGTGSGRIKVWDDTLAPTESSVFTFAGGTTLCSEAEGRTNDIGDGCPATKARLIQPAGIAFAPDGSLLVAELGGNRVRRIDPAGTIWTLAGDASAVIGSAGESGDGGDARAGRLSSPAQVLPTPDGAVYIADLGNHRIRRVSLTGILSTVAGTGHRGYDGNGLPATESRLAYPGGLALAPNGDLYIADGSFAPFLQGSFERGNDCVRRLSLDGRLYDAIGRCGVITECPAGDTCGDGGPASQAILGYVNGLAVDTEGRVYLADHGNSRLRRVRSPSDLPAADRQYVVAPEGREYFVFDVGGRHLETRDALTGALRLSFRYYGAGAADCPGDAALQGRLCSVSDTEGNEVSFTHFAGGVDIEAAHGATTEIRFDDSGYAASLRAGGVGPWQASYALDGFGDTNGLMTSFITPRGDEKRYAYASSGRLIEATSAAGVVRSFLLTRQEEDLDVPGESRRVLRAVTRQPSSRSLVVDITRYVPALDFRVLGNEPAEHVDGDLLRIRLPDQTELLSVAGGTEAASQHAFPSGRRELLEMAPHPRHALPFSYPSRVVVEQGLDADAPRREQTTVWSQRSDPQNALVLEESTRTVTTNGAASLTLHYEEAARSLTQTSPEGRELAYFFDALGRVRQVDDAVAGSVAYARDTQGRISGWTRSAVGETDRTMTVDRGIEGAFLRATLAPQGSEGVDYLFWPDGRIAARRTPSDGATLEVRYGNEGTWQGLVGPAGTELMIDYDEGGRLGALRFSAPRAGDGLVPQLVVSYNEDGQVAAVGGAEEEVGLTFAYDAAGRIETALGHHYAVSWDYDPATGLVAALQRDTEGGPPAVLELRNQGDLLREVEVSGVTAGALRYTYDDFFHRVSDDVSFGGETLSYDTAVDLDGLVLARGDAVFTRDATSGLRTHLRVGRIERETTYNGFGEVTGERYRHMPDAGEATVLLDDSSTRDARGYVVERNEVALGEARALTYRYDGRGRLAAVGGDDPWSYAYDLEDNLVQSQQGEGAGSNTAAYAYDAANQLATSPDETFEFDAAGRLRVRMTSLGARTAYEYDAEGQLVQVDLPDGRVVRYTLDALGRPIARDVDDARSDAWLYDPLGRPAAHTRYHDGAAQTSFLVYADDGYFPAYLEQAGERYALVWDLQRNLRALVHAESGVVRRGYRYDPWGRVVEEVRRDAAGAAADDDELAFALGFAGGLVDGDTGLVRLGARWYAPELRRFLSRDPSILGRAQWNMYAYAHNNPINYLDDNGRFANLLAGCVVGGLTVGAFSALTSALQGYSPGCVLRSAAGGFAGGCAGGALGAMGGFLGSPLISNGIGNAVSAATNMMSGFSSTPDTAAGVIDELQTAFEVGAVAGSLGYASFGLQSGSAVVDDVVTNAAVSGAVAGMDAVRAAMP